MNFRKFLNEDEYKWTGNEQHLFDRPKFAIGEIVNNDYTGKKNKVLEIWDSQDYFRMKHQTHPDRDDYKIYKLANLNGDVLNDMYDERHLSKTTQHK